MAKVMKNFHFFRALSFNIVRAVFPMAITPASAPVGQGQGKQRVEKCWVQERKEPAHYCPQVVFKAPVTYLENSLPFVHFFLILVFVISFFSIFLLVHLLSNGGWVLAEKLCGCHLRRWMLPSQADVGHAAKTDIYNFQLLHLTPKGIIHRWLREQLWQGKYTMNIGIGSWSQKINPPHLPSSKWTSTLTSTLTSTINRIINISNIICLRRVTAAFPSFQKLWYA